MTLEPAVILSQSDFFKTLNSANRKRLAEICLQKSLKKRELLFIEGDKAHALYLCIRGSIQLFKTSEVGQEVVIKVIRPGELFAEAILFEMDRYPVSALALEPSLVYMLPKAQFHCLLENSCFRSDFLANLMGKLRYLTEQVQILSSSDVETRLFRFLKEQYGDRKEIKINLSKKDIAAAIGTTPETLSRLLLRLKEEKKLVWEGRVVKRLAVGE
jgi:CRP-like cAMP-binding protein